MVLKTKTHRRVREDIDRAIKQEGLEEVSRINAYIPVRLHQKLKLHVVQQGKGVTATSIIIKLLDEYLSKNV